jgi:hypothetical protein
MLTIFTARIEDHVLIMLLPRAYLVVLLRIGKTKAFYLFRAGPVHVYLCTAFSPTHPVPYQDAVFPKRPLLYSPRGCLRVLRTLPEDRGIHRGFIGVESWN